MKRWIRRLGLRAVIAAATSLGASTPAMAANGGPLRAVAPCEAHERWELGEVIPADAQAEARALLAGRSSIARSLSEAVAYRRDTAPGAGRAFSEYWIARTLLAAGLPRAAFAGFSSLIAADRGLGGEVLPVAIAAFQCLNKLVERHPALAFPAGTERKLSEALAAVRESSDRRVLWQTAALVLKQQLEEGRSKEEVRRTVALLKGGGAYEAFGLGLLAALNGDLPGTAAEMERFLAVQTSLSGRQPGLDKHLDQARLLAARAYFGLRKFPAASRHLKLVGKSSNDLPIALSELAWSSLSSRDYGEAIGASLSLQAGGLRRTFAPEAPMVLAMAMNELCQFPESLAAVNQFRRQYEASYSWLASRERQGGGEREDLYPLAVAYLRKGRVPVPERVATEWLRSPAFVGSQDLLNLVSAEGEAVSRVGRAGSSEQKALGREIRRASEALIPRLRAERGRPLSPGLRDGLRGLLAKVTHYRRLRAAGPVWRAVAAGQESSGAELRVTTRRRINRELHARNTVMLRKLEEIAENNRLIEVEIYDGAGQDIIWQNAHPDYKQLVKELKSEEGPEEGKATRIASSRVWNWGQAPISSDSWTEIWEDELGSFKSNLFDNCSNKEKYLAIKKERGGARKAKT